MKLLNAIPVDRQAHFWCGWALCVSVGVLSGNALLGFAAAVLADVLYEWLGNRSWMDLLAQSLGAAAGLIVLVWGLA